MNESTFYKKSLLLILTNLTTGILNFVFSVILSRQIGAEGMGLYGLVLPISNLLFSVMSGGLLIAVSKVIAEYYVNKKVNNIKKCIRITIYFNLMTSIFFISIALLLSYQISVNLIKDIRTMQALRFIFISIVCMTLSNTYKGYFYGTTNVFIPAFIDICEKLIRIILILFIFKAIAIDSIQQSITIAYLVFFIGEASSLILLYIYYRLDIKQLGKTFDKQEDKIQLLFNIFVISVPLMLTELVSSFMFTISTLILPRRLLLAGFNYNEALALIGKFASMSMQIVFFPMVIIFSISTILVPDLSSSITKNDTYTIEKRITSVIKVSFLVGVAVFLICYFYGDFLGKTIYKRTDLGQYIKFIAFSAPLLYTSATTRGILNGLGKQKIILKYSLMISLLQVILLYFLIAIPKINIYGFGITIISTTFITLVIYIREIKKVVDIKLFNFRKE